MILFYGCVLLCVTEEERVSASSIANDRTAVARATGWKLHYLDRQLEDVVSEALYTCS